MGAKRKTEEFNASTLKRGRPDMQLTEHPKQVTSSLTGSSSVFNRFHHLKHIHSIVLPTAAQE